MDLKCRKTTCKYNKHYTCVAKNLAITAEISCQSYEHDSTKNVKDSSRCMFEETPRYAPHREKKKLRVACGAKCLFNEQGVCVANGLTVNSCEEIPICMTHIKP